MSLRLWEKVSPGQPPKFKTPEEMWDRAVEYFKDCEQNPLMESKPFAFQGGSWLEEVPKMRAMTQQGLCAYLNISVSTWHNYKSRPEFLEITSLIEAVMFDQKFTGAASGHLNANIIARDLGLADKRDIDLTASGELTPWSGMEAGIDD